MPGDYSRKTFRQNKHYSGVLMQQGRVQLDADWNEQLDIQSYRTHTEAIDVIGQSGAPQHEGGFEIGVTPDGKDLTISRGRFYVEGLLCELDSPSTYITQPHLPNPEFTTVVTSPEPGSTFRLDLEDGHYMVYLDAWQQERTALDDALIREVALGGPDTTTRIQNLWQVKLLRLTEVTPNSEFRCTSRFNEYNIATTASSGRLNARTVPPQPEEDPCLLPPTAGYRSLENQLYRVEIHTGTLVGGPITFKWSRDNASIETAVVSIDDTVATVSETGKDGLLSFGDNQWVEIVDEESTLKGQPHALVQIEKVEPSTREITFKTSLTPFAHLLPGLKLRRWDQSENADENGLEASPDVWVDLEAGIQVQFALGTYRPGDYWLIPGRTATGEIEWPPYETPNTQPLPQPPRGIQHHYGRLALLQVSGGDMPHQDCRNRFPPLTRLHNFFIGGGIGQQAGPGEELPCPLIACVTNGMLPVPFVRVRFAVGDGSGLLHHNALHGTDVIVETDHQGLAWCRWELPREQIPTCLQVRATLEDHSSAVMLHYNASLSTVKVEERGIRVKEIKDNIGPDGNPLRNDTLVPVSRLVNGLTIVCDQKISPLAEGGAPPMDPPSNFPQDRMAGKPTCFVTLDLPFPVTHADRDFWLVNAGETEVVGFQPIILGGKVSIKDNLMVWSPHPGVGIWLQHTLFLKLKFPTPQGGITDRVLAHLTIKGNFVFSSDDHRHNLDGDTFGRPADNGRIDLELPSGDNKRGGDLEMWFWLMERVGVGGRLRLTDVPGTADNTRTIRGSLLDDAGAIVPNSEVKLTGPIGTRSVRSDAQGDFVFVDLPPGTYQVSVQIAGLSAEQSITIG